MVKLENVVFNKVFANSRSELRAVVKSVLLDVASDNAYLEDKTCHADAIHWHLSKLEPEDFIGLLCDFFEQNLKLVKKQVGSRVVIAFDETFIPFYGKSDNNWICDYNNKVKCATGSYKFMVCSIVMQSKRYVLFALPMFNVQNSLDSMKIILDYIKEKFVVKLVICDRGFCNKKIVNMLEQKQIKYLILTPKWTNIKKYLKAKTLEIIETTKFNENKTNFEVDMKYIFTYNFYDHDWVFTTNVKSNPLALILMYKSRWGIETNFRVLDEADIKSKSKNIVTRTFFFWMSIILFNEWLNFNKCVTFNKFINKKSLANQEIKDLLQDFKEAKDFFKIPLTKAEKKIILSFFRKIIKKKRIIFGKIINNFYSQKNIVEI